VNPQQADSEKVSGFCAPTLGRGGAEQGKQRWENLSDFACWVS
jgi:hypothetical protein